MAIYHFSAKVISRSRGSSALAAAAYRSGSRLHDDRLERDHDFSRKTGVVHSEALLPDCAPEEFADRESLWNAVELGEKRKDAQLSREIEFSIPREMSQADGIELARDFVQREFVDRGMIADLNVHWDIGADGQPKPHAHVMLTMREVNEEGFGPKVRDWNKTEMIERWREAWADHVNERLAELDIDVHIDHRSFSDQGIDLEPQNKIGPAASRMEVDDLASERANEHAEIARRNGERIIEDPELALGAITRNQATFTKRDLAMFVHGHTDGKDQFDRAMSAVLTAENTVSLGEDARGQERFTSKEMLEVEARLHRSAGLLADQERHQVDDLERERALAAAEARGLNLSGEQRAAFDHVTDGRDLSVIVGYAGTGKSAMLGVAREAWEDAGYHVQGAALSGIAAENLESGSAIPSRTIASLEHQWGQGRDLLTSRDVLVIDEAGMVGTRQLDRVLEAAQAASAKVVMVGDPEQLQSIEAGAAFRSITERHGAVEITEIRRQSEYWQREATRDFATGHVSEALEAYQDHGMVHGAETREAAREALVSAWDQRRKENPEATSIILTHTNDEVRFLNLLARKKLREAGDLGDDVSLSLDRGERDFAEGDRVMFFKNDRGLGVKNGTLGEIEAVTTESMSVRLDDGRSVAFDLKDYASVDHGYATTIHKAQGMTVDRTHVLATPGLDAQSSYVALSRHRVGVELHYGRDDFADAEKLARTLSRERTKDMASDYGPERDFAEKRGIRLPPAKAPEVERQRSMFDGFKPNLEVALEPMSINPRPRGEDADLKRAVERYARSLADIDRMREAGFPALPHQDAARARARGALEQVRPHAADDMDKALRRNASLVQDAAGGRSQAAMRAMALEAEIRINPQMRADRFVEDWQRLDQRRGRAFEAGRFDVRKRITDRMEEMLDGLHRDPQVDSLLRNRKRELGIEIDRGRGISQALGELIGRGRGMGIGM